MKAQYLHLISSFDWALHFDISSCVLNDLGMRSLCLLNRCVFTHFYPLLLVSYTQRLVFIVCTIAPSFTLRFGYTTTTKYVPPCKHSTLNFSVCDSLYLMENFTLCLVNYLCDFILHMDCEFFILLTVIPYLLKFILHGDCDLQFDFYTCMIFLMSDLFKEPIFIIFRQRYHFIDSKSCGIILKRYCWT